jgi:hypothetical protein
VTVLLGKKRKAGERAETPVWEGLKESNSSPRLNDLKDLILGGKGRRGGGH